MMNEQGQTVNCINKTATSHPGRIKLGDCQTARSKKTRAFFPPVSRELKKAISGETSLKIEMSS